MKCSICGKIAVITRQHEGRALCRKHFFDSVDRNVRKTIRLLGLLPRGSHVAIGVAGDESSILLLYQLHKLNLKRKDLTISVVSVDEGIRGYRGKFIPVVEKKCRELDVSFYQTRFKDVFGMSVDDVSGKVKGNSPDLCSYCRTMRLAALRRMAIKIKADKIAIGTNMDDEAVAITSKYFGYSELADLGDVVKGSIDVRSIDIIKPLSSVPEDECALYAKLKGFDVMTVVCPYGEGAFGWIVKKIIDELESKHAGIKSNIIKSEEKMQILCIDNMGQRRVD